MMINSFIFGIYPGGMSGTETGLTAGSPDIPEKITAALDVLQGDTKDFLVRIYKGYKGLGETGYETPTHACQYAINGRQLDLVLCFQSLEEDLSGWKLFIADCITEFGAHMAKLQITEEANVKLPSLDGFYENSRKALVEGVILAKVILRKLQLNVQVGFNATPDFNPDRTFWIEIAQLASAEFYESLDYVGLDFFPDVFRRLSPHTDNLELSGAIAAVLSTFRKDMATAGIKVSTPIHITENGWPTSIERSHAEQAVMLEKIVRVIHTLRREHQITHYELFDLRDANSNVNDIFYQFGIMKDDYSPKPAFHVYKRLIDELSIEGNPVEGLLKQKA